MINKKVILFLLISLYCMASNREEKVRAYFFSSDICELDITDWTNPTKEDYWKIQYFLNNKKVNLICSPLARRPFPNDSLNKNFYGSLTYRMGRTFLISTSQDPSFHIEYLGNDPQKKDKCVICYASFSTPSANREYIKGIDYILNALKKQHFDGHFIYYIGGWPNVKKGRLKYADVPYAFKPFLFEEVRDMGYKNILWIDSCVIPVKSLDPVFTRIQKFGLCFLSFQELREMAEGYLYICPSLISNMKKYERISSQIVGIDVTNKKANNLLNQWIQAAEKKVPFLQSDEPPFVFLVNKLHLLHGKLPQHYYVTTPCNSGNFSYWNWNERAILYHQYDFLDPNITVPDYFSKP